MPSSLPSLSGSYLRFLLHRRPALTAQTRVPLLEWQCHDLQFQPNKLRAYRDACQLQDDGQVPLFYPQVLAMPMHMRLLADRRMPVSGLGMVHLRNQVQRYRYLPLAARFELRCRVLGQRCTRRGLEVDIGSELWHAGECYWQALSTYLKQARLLPTGDEGEAVPAQCCWPALSEVEQQLEWAVPRTAGWRYGWISGDFNPIHVSNLAARGFGFPQAIAHGMWALGRSLSGRSYPEQVRLDVRFSAPVLLGSRVCQQHQRLPDGEQWQLLALDGEPRPLVQARLLQQPAQPLFGQLGDRP